MIAFPPFAVKELEYRIVSRCVLDDGGHDLEKCFAQMRRAALGGWITCGDILARLVYRRINVGEAHDGTAAGEAAHIANLGHELYGGGFAYTVHGPDRLVFRELPGQLGHLRAHDDQRNLRKSQSLAAVVMSNLVLLFLISSVICPALPIYVSAALDALK